MKKVEEIIGKGLLGFPNSEILSAVYIGNDLEDWQGGGPTYLVRVRVQDGRILEIPMVRRRIRTYDRKVEGSD